MPIPATWCLAQDRGITTPGRRLHFDVWRYARLFRATQNAQNVNAFLESPQAAPADAAYARSSLKLFIPCILHRGICELPDVAEERRVKYHPAVSVDEHSACGVQYLLLWPFGVSSRLLSRGAPWILAPLCFRRAIYGG